MFRTLIATLAAHLTLLAGASQANPGRPMSRPMPAPTFRPPANRPPAALPPARPPVTTPPRGTTLPAPRTNLPPVSRPVTVAKYPQTVRAPGGARIPASAYSAQHGTRLKNGRVVYRGLHHRHWSRRAFSHRWRCWVWFCPSVGGWYYWAPARGLYLPVAYLPVVAPATSDPGAVDPGSSGSASEQPPGASEVPVEEGDLNLPEPPG